MAFEGTHIRFALDVKEQFEVQDLKPYVSGSIYPDSRYQTGIDRELTHDAEFMMPEFWHNSDFRKGWATHLLYDKIQGTIHKDWFAEMLEGKNKEQSWVIRTALKMVQDLQDIALFDITSHLPALAYIETPNQENPEIMSVYNSKFIQLYANPQSMTVEDYRPMWDDWSVNDPLIQEIELTAKKFMADPDMVATIERIYPTTLEMVDSELKSLSGKKL